ncbi:MAG TPA: polysaccharide deacetylase family protein [Candidatus Saccharimonadales bacterium]|nr:polysaccharide deacetylase family protein [Candidatus Saccharimonadales bacterium]
MKGRIISSSDLQRFLIAVGFWVLAIISIHCVHNSHLSAVNIAKKIESLSLSITFPSHQDTTSRSAPQAQTITSPAIAAWQGPIQPVNIQTSDMAPVILRVPTTEPVVFVGIDDGWVQAKPTQAWLIKHHLPFSLFLTNNGIKNDYGYFKKLQSAGMTIEDHSLTHPNLTKLNLDQQKAEICATADIYQTVFGRRPTLFRPPYGAYNDNTRRAAASCGIKAIVMWHVNVGTGGDVQFQSNSTHLQPGDIVLMHFNPEFLQDMQSLAEAVTQNHLQIGRLEDWLPQ